MRSFIAIDFETAQPTRYSPCAIGMVKVVDGVITQRIFTLIRPPDNVYSPHNTNVHGITAVHSKNAPEFTEVYRLIKEMVHQNHVVCHNASFDLEVLRQSKEHHGIVDDLEYTYSDTLDLYGKSLDVCCEICGIDLHHHDALSDAEACARLFLRYHKIPENDYKTFGSKAKQQLFEDHGKLDHDLFKPELDSVMNKNNPFFNKKVVITGVYQTWPDRNDLAKIIKQFGADIDSGVTSKTQILIAGANSGPVKIQKMQANIDIDNTRKIMSEEDVLGVFKTLEDL
ncbi:MAG: exonuclease domain-containing protein [Bacteroidetes bacterium]|nr:exonuclease domain-containing protein [Bacteroidota bacterium]